MGTTTLGPNARTISAAPGASMVHAPPTGMRRMSRGVNSWICRGLSPLALTSPIWHTRRRSHLEEVGGVALAGRVAPGPGGHDAGDVDAGQLVLARSRPAPVGRRPRPHGSCGWDGDGLWEAPGLLGPAATAVLQVDGRRAGGPCMGTTTLGPNARTISSGCQEASMVHAPPTGMRRMSMGVNLLDLPGAELGALHPPYGTLSRRFDPLPEEIGGVALAGRVASLRLPGGHDAGDVDAGHLVLARPVQHPCESPAQGLTAAVVGMAMADGGQRRGRLQGAPGRWTRRPRAVRDPLGCLIGADAEARVSQPR